MELIRVLLINLPDLRTVDEMVLPAPFPTEAAGFDVIVADDDSELVGKLAAARPHVIVTYGEIEWYPELGAAGMDVRKRWIHLEDAATPMVDVAQSVMACFMANATTDRFPEAPLVSVFTCTYGTGEEVRRAYESICRQTYPDWEWVVYDDSDDGGETFGYLAEIAHQDVRVKLFRGIGNSGSIGEVKRRACGLCTGAIMVELDHDDVLLARCLEHVVAASIEFPDAGFFYSDGAEVMRSGGPARYPEGWGFGYGSYRQEVVDGEDLLVQCYPPVNAKTIRHIVGAPNHVRAWTRDAYHRSGGHQPDLHVCDDYDLCIRMFLTTRMVHIQECCYVQVHDDVGGGNTQRARNEEIQRLTRYLMLHYNDQIHARFVELGVDDFIWSDGALDWSAPSPPDADRANHTWSAALTAVAT